jgi:Icc protein
MAGKNDFKVLQVTDTHLFAKTKEMFGIDCNKNFLSVIDEIKQNEKGFDFILATGDIAQDESIEVYQFFRDSLNSFKVPVYWISGNHDDPIKMQEVFSQSPYFFQQKKLTVHNWDFIFIDSKISGKDTGLITDNELKKLEVQLSQGQRDENWYHGCND